MPTTKWATHFVIVENADDQHGWLAARRRGGITVIVVKVVKIVIDIRFARHLKVVLGDHADGAIVLGPVPLLVVILENAQPSTL